MGCCSTSFDINVTPLKLIHSLRTDLPLTQAEKIELETFLINIPDNCQQTLINLSERQLLNLIQEHKMALHYASKKDWSLVIYHERHVIKGLQTLLPMEKDHYIFCIFYNVLSASFLALGELESAIEGFQIVLAIRLKYTLMDYRTISKHFLHLADIYKVSQDWKEVVQHLLKAIEIARKIEQFDQEYISMLENELHKAKQQMTEKISKNVTSFQHHHICVDSDRNLHRRLTAVIIALSTKHDTLSFQKNNIEQLSEN